MSPQEISVEDWPESAEFQDSRFVEVGWGDAAYYRSRSMNPLVIANAALLPSSSAIHAAGFEQTPQEFFPKSQIVELKVAPDRMRKLCRFISNSYQRDRRGKPKRLGRAKYGRGHLCRASGFYYLPKTCNIWTAQALNAAECPVTVPLCSVAQPLLLQAKTFGTEIQAGSSLPSIYPFINFETAPATGGRPIRVPIATSRNRIR